MAKAFQDTLVSPEPALTFPEFYDAALAVPEVAVYVIRVGDDGALTFEDANEVVSRISGRSVDEIRGRPVAEVLIPEVAECVTKHVGICASTGEPMAYQRTFDTPVGRASFKTSLSPVSPGPEGVKFVLGVTRDLTQEVNRLEHAERHAALFRALGVALPSAIYLLDLESKTLKFVGGEASSKQLEWRKGAEGVGPEKSAKFFHPEDWPRAQAHWAELEALPDGKVATISYRLLAEKGKYRRHLHREIVFSRDAEGKVKLVLGVSEDVSEQDRMEQEVRDLSARMLTLQLEERRRIAHELHDSTGQHLVAATLALNNAQAIGEAAEESCCVSLLAVVEDAAACVADAQREIQVLSYLLHPPELLSQGLPEAIENFAKGFAKRARIRITVDVDAAACTIDDDTAVSLFRICQEALTNVYRHADARKAQVVLELDEASICLIVKDDGIGFDGSAQETMLGVGLSGMRERIGRMGGTFRITGDPSGTTLEACLPRMHKPMPAKRRWDLSALLPGGRERTV